MDAIEVLKSRRSVRNYKPDPLDKCTIEDIIDCGRLAASALNIQPLHFVVVTDEKTKKDIVALAPNGRPIAKAPACIIVLAERSDFYSVEDGSAATQNILNAAKAYGLGSCWIAGHGKPYADKISALINAPGNYMLISMISIGFPDDNNFPQKKPLKDVLSWEKF